MSERLSVALTEFGVLLVELAVLLVVVSALMALMARRIGISRLQNWLGGGRLPGAAKGILLGFLTPFCTYSAIPVVIGMINARIQTATLTAFLLSSPVLDPVIVAILIPLFGWKVTVAYVVATCLAVLLAALMADVAHLERALRPAKASAAVVTSERGPVAHPVSADDTCASPLYDPFTETAAWGGWRAEARPALRYALDLARSLAIPLIVSVAIAAAILGLVPQELVARLAGPGNPLAVPVAAVLGAPFYVSTEAFLPIAAALHEAGMSLGAVFALIISAAGVNVPELGLLSRVMSRRLLAIYTLTVVGIAIAAGYLVMLS
ncbi:permease [Streptomyces phaeochromogenes]|uniref:permease n=1 Tax=Streptomyces phaeochromogenes TaxID=1923 RepID=UPI0038653E6F|nr:permease [Streptomyces phaeochromogenes]